MSLPAIVMPADVPDWRVEPHDQTLRQPFALVAFASGAGRMRRTTTGAVRMIEAELQMLEAAAATFHAWFEDTLQAGALPFSARVLGDDGARTWWHARFAAPPQWSAAATAAGPLWRVAASLRLQGEPSTEAPA